MTMLIVLSLTVIAACVAAAWPSRAGDAEEPAAEVAPAGPESLEGVLVGQLVRDEITARQYRRAMARLAARDDERHPLVVPPELGSADA